MTLARETARNALLMIAARSSSLVISIGSIYFYTRWLNADELAFLTVLGVLAQTCIVLDLGLGLAVDRRLPGLMEADRQSGRDLARSYLWTSMAISAAICVALALLAGPISREFLDGKIAPELIYWGIPLVLATVGHQLLTVLLRGTGNYASLSICIPVNQILWSTLSIGAYFVISRGLAPGIQHAMGASAAFKSFILLQGIGQIPALVMFSRPLWHLLGGMPTPAAITQQLKRALPFHAERYVNFIATFGDQWVVAAFMTNELKAIYYVPRTFFDRLTTTLDGITAVPLTALSTAAARGRESLLRGILVMRRALLFIFGMVGASLLVGSHFLVDLFAGSKYEAGGVIPFRILSIHFVVVGMYMIHQQAVNAAGRPGDRLRVVLIQNAVSLIALAVLGWLFSLNGVVAARVVGALAGGWASWYYLRKIVPLRPDWNAMRLIAVPCLTVITFVLLTERFHYVGIPDTWSVLRCATQLALSILVMGLLLLYTMPESDMQNIEEVLPSRLSWAKVLGRRLRQRSAAPPPGHAAAVVPTGLANPQLEDISNAKL